MAATIVGVFQPEMQNLIKDSKILLVGAGGIGCEVLKNLVLMGFSDLEVIDLDTIVVSNLNRQFLFNMQSVGKAKSHVARESVLKFNPNVNIKSYLGNIMNQNYDEVFFSKFKLVINALDNGKARAHVNRMCLSVDIPLIESGTMGYCGQVDFIKKGVSLCYECLPKPEPNSYSICTIRNCPTEPIHCIIWAKLLFNQLFGKLDTDDEVSMAVNQKHNLPKLSVREWAMKKNYEPSKMFKKLFIDDIQYLSSMKELFNDVGIKPIPMPESLLSEDYADYSHEPDFLILELPQYVSMFKDSIINIINKFDVTNENLVWDKDDDDFMNFIVSCTNLRSTIFEIPLKSHFDIKSMAGNIIPAIATTNAIIAGQIVIHVLRSLRKNYERCQSIFLRAKPNHNGAVLVKDKKLESPNPECFVCTKQGELILCLDTKHFTVKQLDELVLKKKLNMVLPDVMVDDRIIISSNKENNLDLYSFPLYYVDVMHGSRLKVDDYFQNYSVNIIVHHKKKVTEEEPDFELFNNLKTLKNCDEEMSSEQNATAAQVNDHFVIEKFGQDKNKANENEVNLEPVENVPAGTIILQVIDNEHEMNDIEESLAASGNQEVSNSNKCINATAAQVNDHCVIEKFGQDKNKANENEVNLEAVENEPAEKIILLVIDNEHEMNDIEESLAASGNQEVSNSNKCINATAAQVNDHCVIEKFGQDKNKANENEVNLEAVENEPAEKIILLVIDNEHEMNDIEESLAASGNQEVSNSNKCINATAAQVNDHCVIEKFGQDKNKANENEVNLEVVENEPAETIILQVIDNEHEINDIEESLVASGNQEISNSNKCINATAAQVNDHCVIEKFGQDKNKANENEVNLEVVENEPAETIILQVIDNEHEINDIEESLVASGNQEVSNEEILALKRKPENEEDTSGLKKTRINE